MIILNYDTFGKIQKFQSINESDTQDDPDNLLRKEAMGDVSRCVSRALSKYPFFGEYLIDCRFLYDHPNVNTMATDGKNIFISSKFAASLDDNEMTFILCHEVLHIMLCHHLRMANKFGAHPSSGIANKWNYAADYELNPMLVRDGLLTREQVINDIKGCYEDKYIGKSAETIYDEMNDGEDGQEPPPGGADYPANVGNIVHTKSGNYGQITKINANGTYDIKDLTEAEAMAILKV